MKKTLAKEYPFKKSRKNVEKIFIGKANDLFHYLRHLPYFYRHYGPRMFCKKIIKKIFTQNILKIKGTMEKWLIPNFIKNFIVNKVISKNLPIFMKKMPALVYIEINTYCDMSCIMCGRPYYKLSKSDQGFMSKEIFNRSLPLVTKDCQIALYGRGEPLLHKDFIYFLKELKQRKAKVVFNTSGKGLTADIIKALVYYNTDRITLSCSAGTKLNYEYIHRGNTWDNFWNNVDKLHKARVKENRRGMGSLFIPAIYLEFVAQRRNIEELPLLVERVFDYRLDGILIDDLVAHTKELEKQRMNTPDTIPLARKYYKLAEEVVRKRRHENPHFWIKFPDFYYSQNKNIASGKSKDDLATTKNICLEPWQTFYVRFDGTVTPCCITNRVMGHLNQNTAKEIWNGTMFQKFRERMLSADKPFECLRCHLMTDQACYDKALDDLSKYDPL